MIKAVIFGGTTEGRKLCEFCAKNAIPVKYSVATEDGARFVTALPDISISKGRLNAAAMAELFKKDQPLLVIDATHPYAEEAGKNIAAACGQSGVRLVRIRREGLKTPGCLYFNSMEDLLLYLKKEPGNIFVSTGSSLAKAFTKLPDYQNRIWLRIVPSLSSLKTCLAAGYSPRQLICMQGPFSQEINLVMFKNAKARILVTKDSGTPGGFAEKVQAAQMLGMIIAVLAKPEETGGIALADAYKILRELAE